MESPELRNRKKLQTVIDPNLFEDASELCDRFPGEHKPVRAFVDRQNGWCMQVFQDAHGCDDTPWRGTLRVGVCHTAATNVHDFFNRQFGIPITWDELQSIKDHWWPTQIAIEVYPPHEKVVDAANMRWLWVLPRGAILPFNLQATSPTRLEG